MSRIFDYLQLAVEGFAGFITDYKMLPLVIGVMLYAVLREKKYGEKCRWFLIYVSVVVVLLLVPVTAAIFLVYQTRFYDYGWIWSMLPLGAVLAWGVVELVYEQLSAYVEEFSKRLKNKTALVRILGAAAAVIILWLCGNQGQLQKVSDETLQKQKVAEAILEYMEENELLETGVVWAPKEMMQYMRAYSGEVTLFYGKDMWDAKAGAYDYDAYTSEEIACYEWMELLSDTRNLYLLEVDQASEQMHQALADNTHLKNAVESQVNIIILPEQMTPWMERKLEAIAEAKDLNLSAVKAADYVLWKLE